MRVSGLSDLATAKIEEEVGLKASKCGAECGVCFTVSENKSGVKQKASIVVKEGTNGMVDVQV